MIGLQLNIHPFSFSTVRLSLQTTLTHKKEEDFTAQVVTYVTDTSLTANMKGPLLSSQSPICANNYTYVTKHEL